MQLGLVLLNCMTLPNSENFCNEIKQEVGGYSTHIDLEAASRKRNKSLVVGKIIKILYSLENKIIIQVKEVLPNFEYGQKFNAVIHRTLAEQFTKYALKPGDSLAFYEPFVFLNPAFQSSEPKYLLEIGGLDNSKMWCAKSQSPLVKNKMSEKKVNNESKSMPDDKDKQTADIPDNEQGTLRKRSGAESVKDLRSGMKASNNTNNKDNLNPGIARKNENEDKTAKNRNNLNIIEKDSPDTRQRPQIQLPLNPQIPLNTKRLNPQYTYKTLQEVRDDAMLGEMGKVNILVVVHKIIQGLAKTSTGKFSLRCKVIDESTGLNNSFHLNFFTAGSNVIQEIEEGDIVRLHRVQVEIYQNVPDGRIFYENDILLYKKNATEPLTTAKNYQITEEDKRNMERLRKWLEDSQQCPSEIRLLGSIQKEGEFHIACQLVSQELVANESVKLRVADGSVIRTLARGPAPPHLEVTDQATGHLVTEIEVINQLNIFANLKAGTFLHLCQVKAVKTDKLRLKLNAKGAPMLLSEDSDKVMEINQRLEVMKGRIEESVKNKINEKDHEVSPNNQQSSENNYTPRTRNRTSKFNRTDSEKVKNTDSCTIQCQIVETTTEVSGVTKVASEGALVDDSLITALNQLCSDKREDLNNTERKQLDKMSPCNTCPRQNVSRHPSKAPQMKDDEIGLKRRKPLFTANYSDLSDATDELSEVVESGNGEKGGEGVTGPEVVVVPVNTSFVDVMQLLETKCSPRKRIHSHSQIQNCQERKTDVNCAKEKYPYVKLIKLDNECKHSPNRGALDKSGTSSRSKKLSVEDDDVNTSAEECIEIASTVKNMSYQKVFSENIIRNKEINNESLSTQDNAVDLIPPEDVDVSTIPKVQVDQKVSHWLSQCHGDLDQTIELDPFEAQKILLGLDEDKALDMSECVRTSSRRLRVFLDRIIPDPSTNPLDLVSGVCVNGCKDFFLYSCIHWQADNDNYFPLCPSCKKLKLKNNLLLTLFFELKVIDMKGHSDKVMVCKDEAETFLNCSTKDFLKDQEIRKSRVKQLTDGALLYSLSQNEPGNKPILDLSVILIKNQLLLVNTSFKLPSTP